MGHNYKGTSECYPEQPGLFLSLHGWLSFLSGSRERIKAPHGHVYSSRLSLNYIRPLLLRPERDVECQVGRVVTYLVYYLVQFVMT